MNILETQGWLMICLEAGVLWILIKEFNYDKDKYERQAQRKNRKDILNEKAKNIGNETSVSNQINLEQKQGTPGNP